MADNKSNLSVGSATGTAQEMQQNDTHQARPCPKDCRRCTMTQQLCCASMLSFQSFDVMNIIIQRLDIQSERIAELETRIAAIQSSEAELATPCVTLNDAGISDDC